MLLEVFEFFYVFELTLLSCIIYRWPKLPQSCESIWIFFNEVKQDFKCTISQFSLFHFFTWDFVLAPNQKISDLFLPWSRSKGGGSKPPDGSTWSGDSSRNRGFGTTENTVTVTVKADGDLSPGKDVNAPKAVPDWIKKSTVSGVPMEQEKAVSVYTAYSLAACGRTGVSSSPAHFFSHNIAGCHHICEILKVLLTI